MKIIMGIMTIIIVFGLSGCGWLDNKINHISLGFTSGNYNVTMYSGGVAVKQWVLNDVLIQTEKTSDGFYWSDNGKIIRISGDIVIQER